ncbi:RHS repeat protein [Flavobacterium amniphilum]|uniref:RHS repeat domain-containing protein n=1 Tax=Flavobacterium amniphilum TaxID=1834035 RepID=UPI00202A7B5E|nr:RHS repeat domain-containing protein [Flavobacterium amniphilum]MCL9804654.1 RHS repeat protein [Flavobacterium amniphilum]
MRPNPTLYYYPNQFEKSLLPFPVPGMQYTTIPGIFNRQANDYAKAWSLNKVEYPTGGSSEYVYESNEFEVFGQTIKGGGVRIAKQLLKDGLGNTREIQYTYTKAGGGTSGSLGSFPYFGHPTVGFFPVSIDYPHVPRDEFYDAVSTVTPSGTSFDIDHWKLYDKGKLNADITSGSFVGYSRVIEKEVNNGYKEFLYTSSDLAGFKNKFYRVIPQKSRDLYGMSILNNCITEFMVANSGFGSEIFNDNSYKRGKLLEENVFNESNQLLKKTFVDYTDFLITKYNYAQGFIAPVPSQSEEDNVRGFFTAEKDYRISQFLPIKETTTSYDNNGAPNIVEVDFAYNTYGLLKTRAVKDSRGNSKISQTYYPTDVTTATSLPGGTLTTSELSAYQGMKSNGINNISEQIQIENFLNTTKMATRRQTFKERPVSLGGGILYETMKTAKDSDSLLNEYTIHKYEDGTSNPIEISKEQGEKTVLIWGYKKGKLLAKIGNATYASIPAATIVNLQSLSDADNDNCKDSTCKEQLLRNALEALRVSLPDAEVTTYTHDWLVGITSVTDVRGYTIYYEYDSLGRLISEKNPEGKIITKNEYNFHQ